MPPTPTPQQSFPPLTPVLQMPAAPVFPNTFVAAQESRDEGKVSNILVNLGETKEDKVELKTFPY